MFRTTVENRNTVYGNREDKYFPITKEPIEIYDPRSCFYDYGEKRPMEFGGIVDDDRLDGIAEQTEKWFMGSN